MPCRPIGVSPTAGQPPATSPDFGPRPVGHAELWPGLGLEDTATAYAAGKAGKALGTHGEPCDFNSWGAPVEFWQICGRNSIRSPQFDGEIWGADPRDSESQSGYPGGKMSKLQLMDREIDNFNTFHVTWECRQTELYKCNSNLRNLRPSTQHGCNDKPHAHSLFRKQTQLFLTGAWQISNSFWGQRVAKLSSMILILSFAFREPTHKKTKAVSWAKIPNLPRRQTKRIKKARSCVIRFLISTLSYRLLPSRPSASWPTPMAKQPWWALNWRCPPWSQGM